jgi:hypothetical protein
MAYALTSVEIMSTESGTEHVQEELQYEAISDLSEVLLSL